MRVYADVLFLLNAVADYVLLLAAARLAGVRTRASRLAAGAALGGVYAVIALLRPALGSAPGLLLAAVAMVLCAFAPQPWRALLRALACLCGVGLLAGGLALALSRSAAGGIPVWDILAALGGALVAGAAVADRRAGTRATAFCDLELEVRGKRARCRALVDTGNRLRDPCRAAPVVVVDETVLRDVVPAPLLLSLAAGPAALPRGLAQVAAGGASLRPGPGEWAHRVCLVPYRAVGVGGGMLCGVRADALRISGHGAPVGQAVIAVSPAPLDPDGMFRALVPAALVAGMPGERPPARWGRVKEGASGDA